jgi:hypothetical protein
MLFGTMSNTKQKLFVAGSSETFLSALFIDPLAIEVAASMQAKLRFRHGKRLLLESVLSELVGPDLLSSRAKTGTAVFKDPVYHKCTLSTGSTDHQISVNGHFNFADSASSVEAPFVNISWSEIAFTLFPGLSAVELLTFKLRKGKFNLYLLSEKNPILLIHDGFVDFAVNLHTKESSKHQKLDSFLMNWKSFVRSLVNPTASKFVPVSIHGQSGVDSFKIDTSVPTRTALLPFLHAFILKSTNSIHELPKNWENWFKSLAETTVKVSGLRGLTTQLLLEMPQMEIFSNPHEPDSFGLDVRVEMTSIDLNICRRNRDSGIISYSLWFCFSHPVLFLDVLDLNESPDRTRKGSWLSNQACLMQVGLQPMVFDVKIFNGSICGVLTGVNDAPLHTRAKAAATTQDNESDDSGSIEDSAQSRINRVFLEKTFASPEDTINQTSLAEIRDPLINLVPINVSLIDLDGLVQLVMDVSENGWDSLRVSLGSLKEELIRELGKDFQETSSLLLNRLSNTIGSMFAFSAKDGMEQLLKSTGKKAAPPIEAFNFKDAMNLLLDIKSPNRNLIVGSVKIVFPESSLQTDGQKPVEEDEEESTDEVVNIVPLPQSLPESVLVNMQWGDLRIRLAHKTSFLELFIPEGRVALRVHKTSGIVSMDSVDDFFSRKLGLQFRLFFDATHVSSLTLRRIVDRVSFWRSTSGARKKKKSKVSAYSQAILEAVQTRHLDMDVQLKPFSLDTRDQQTHVVRSEVPISPLIHLIHHLSEKVEKFTKKAMKSSRKVSHDLPQVSITPVPLQSSVKLPCLVPILCSKKQMRRSLSKDLRLLKVNIEIRRVMQSVADVIGNLVGIFVEKLNFRKHPAILNLAVKTSAVSFGFAVNGVEALEFDVEPFKLERTAAIVYSGHLKAFSTADILQLRQTDSFQFQVVTKLSPAVKNINQVLTPLILDPDHGILMAKLPDFHPTHLDKSPFNRHKQQQKHQKSKRSKRKSSKIHHIPLVMTMQNESTRHTSLLSSLIAFAVPSLNLGPIDIDPVAAAKAMKRAKIPKPKIVLEHASEHDLVVHISKIHIPNPLPVSITINHKISMEIRHQKYSFIRAAIDGKALKIHANKPTKLSAHLVLSKNAFGKLPPNKAQVFREFISDLAFGRPVEFEIIFIIGKHSMHLPVGLDWREISTAVFNADKVDADYLRANYLVDSLTTGLGSIFNFGRTVTRDTLAQTGFDSLSSNPIIRGARAFTRDLLWFTGFGGDNEDSETTNSSPSPSRPTDLFSAIRQERARNASSKSKKKSKKSKSSEQVSTESTEDSSSESDSWETASSSNSSSTTTRSSSSSNSSSSNSSSSTGSSSGSSSSSPSSSTSDSSGSYKRYKRSLHYDEEEEEMEDVAGSLPQLSQFSPFVSSIYNPTAIDHHLFASNGSSESPVGRVRSIGSINVDPKGPPIRIFDTDNMFPCTSASSHDYFDEPTLEVAVSLSSESVHSSDDGSIDNVENSHVVENGETEEASPVNYPPPKKPGFFQSILSAIGLSSHNKRYLSSEDSSTNVSESDGDGFETDDRSFITAASPGLITDNEEGEEEVPLDEQQREDDVVLNVVHAEPGIEENVSDEDDAYFDQERFDAQFSAEEIFGFPSPPVIDGDDQVDDEEERFQAFSDRGDAASVESLASNLSLIREQNFGSESPLPKISKSVQWKVPSSNSSSSSSTSSSKSKNKSKRKSKNKSSSSSSSSTSTSNSSSTASSLRREILDLEKNPIRRTFKNRLVRYKDIKTAPRIFPTTIKATGKGGDGRLDPGLVLKQVDAKRLKSSTLIDTRNFRRIGSSSSSSRSSSSDSSDSDSSHGHKHKHKKRRHSKKSKKQQKADLGKYFTIQRNLDPAADNPTSTPGFIDQTLHTFYNIANHVRVKLYFNNPSDFPVYLLGTNMRVVIDDMDLLWSSLIGGRVIPTSYLDQAVEARMFQAPQACRPASVDGIRALSPEAFFKCCFENRSKPVEVILPAPAETEISSYIYLKNTASTLQVLDEMLMHDGLCTHVIDSPVSIALEANNGRPFVLELIANIPDQPGRPREFGDPCRLETKCHVTSRMQIPIGHVTRSNRNGHVDLYNPSAARVLIRNESDFGQLWRNDPIDLTADFEMSVRLEIEAASSFNRTSGEVFEQSASVNYDSPDCESDKSPSIGVVFLGKTPTGKDFTAGTGEYGLSGLHTENGHSLAVLLDPKTSTISLVLDGDTERPLMSKTSGAFPHNLASHPIVLSIKHRPLAQKLIITVQPELPVQSNSASLKPFYFTTVFPVNIGGLLGVLKGADGDHRRDRKVRYRAAHKSAVGLTASSANHFRRININNWTLDAIMPVLSSTQVYFDQKKLATPNSPGKFLLQLRDSCGKPINGLNMRGKTVLGVQMRLISASSRKSNENYLIDDLSDDDYSIHHQTDTRPSTKPSKPRKHPLNASHLTSPHSQKGHAFALSEEPRDYWIQNVTVRHIPHFGLYEVNYVSEMSGRFEIYLAIGKKTKRKRNHSSNSGSDSDSDSSSTSSSSSSSSSSSTSSSSSSSSKSDNDDSDSSSTGSTSSSNSSSSSYDSDDDESPKNGINFKPLNKYNWTRLDSFTMLVPSCW